MGSVDDAVVQAGPEAELRARVRRRYELSRLRQALAGSLPVLVLAAVAVVATQRPWAAVTCGGAALAACVLFLWYGRAAQRAVLPGLLAGVVPLALALAANHVHACGPEGCRSFCVPACTAGGVVAGIAIAVVGLRRRERLWFWLAASGVAVSVGAMGCSCVGGGGIIGLLAGYASGVVPGLLRRLASRAPQT